MSTHTIKGLREQFKAVGKFHTPPELALFLRALIPGEPDKVYDPTCGAGALLSVFPDGCAKYGQDIDAVALEDAALLPNFTGHLGDVFTDPAWVDERFGSIVANPPFSVRWEPQADERFMTVPTVPTASRADYAFLIHILHMLAPDGTAAVLQFPGVLYRGGREGVLREWMVRENFVDQVIRIPGGSFTDTSIDTACLVLRKNRESTDITFTDQENGLTETVTFALLEAAGFNLSVSRWVREPEPERGLFDALGTEMTARRGFLRKLRAELRFSRQVAEFEGFDWREFVTQIRAVLDEEETA